MSVVRRGRQGRNCLARDFLRGHMKHNAQIKRKSDNAKMVGNGGFSGSTQLGGSQDEMSENPYRIKGNWGGGISAMGYPYAFIPPPPFNGGHAPASPLLGNPNHRVPIYRGLLFREKLHFL